MKARWLVVAGLAGLLTAGVAFAEMSGFHGNDIRVMNNGKTATISSGTLTADTTLTLPAVTANVPGYIKSKTVTITTTATSGTTGLDSTLADCEATIGGVSLFNTDGVQFNINAFSHDLATGNTTVSIGNGAPGTPVTIRIVYFKVH